MIRWALAGAIALLAAIGVWLRPQPEWRFVVPEGAKLGTGPSFETVFRYTSPEGTAHAPAIVPDGVGFDLIWFDGIRESHNDVRILQADVDSGAVSELITRQDVSARMQPLQTVLTLGNAIDAGEAVLVTAVSLGGWAASSVVADRGTSARKLNMSPILNRSHLVKSPVVPMSSGQFLLPSYFEMGAAFGVLAQVDAAFRVRGQSIIPGQAAGIQPMVVALTETDAVAILRRFDGTQDRVLASWTRDGGQHWSDAEPLALPNPSAPVAMVRLDDGRLLMVFNDDADQADVLRFAVSEDAGRTWARRRVLDGPGSGDLRYPMMAVLPDGRIAVTYSTGSKAGIVAHVLSADWALAQ